jgi:hypothetical protein
MAETLTLTNVNSFTNDTTAVNAVNGNFTAITTAFTDVLSRSGVSPNQMTSALDMNTNQIINLPAPSTVNSPARLIDVVSNPTITVPGTGTSGHTVPFLDGANTWSGTNTFNAAITFNTNPTLNANAISRATLAQGSARSVIGVTGNATANVADIQGTTRQVLAVNTAGTALVFAQPQGDQLLGTIANDAASAGNVGEYVSSTINSGSAVALSTNVAANITSVSLTAGDWDIWSNLYFLAAGTTSITILQGSLSTTSATLNVNPGFWGVQATPASVIGANTTGLDVGPVRLSLAGTTTLFIVAQATFTVSTLSGYGIIQARRVR